MNNLHRNKLTAARFTRAVLLVIAVPLWNSGYAPVWSQSTVAPIGVDEPLPSASQIPNLIRQLDSSKYDERQRATDSLVSLGSAALRPLARQYLESSPEAMWRTRKIIEEIGVLGDEPTFFRAAALLKLMCSEQTDVSHRLQQHYRRWQSIQIARAAEKLQALGAIVQLYDQHNDGIHQDIREILVFVEPQIESALSENTPTRPAKPSTPSPSWESDEAAEKQFLKKIDQVLVASMEQNRQFAFEGDGASGNNISTRQPLRALEQQRHFHDHLVVLPDGRFVFSEQHFVGSQITFDQNWRGELADFQFIAAIEGIADVRFRSRAVQAEQLEVLNRIPSIATIRLSSCELDAAAWNTLAAHPKVMQVVIDSVKIDQGATRALAAIPQLTTLKLANTPLTEDALQPLEESKQLALLIMENVQLRAEHVDAISRMPRVSHLQLTGCKFSLDDYRRLVEKPGLEVNVIGHALLGIREARVASSQAPESCQIGEVIAGSGADLAGLQVGDCILQINEQSVKSFRELVAVVSQFQPGDQLKLKVLRGGQVLDLRATLGARN